MRITCCIRRLELYTLHPVMCCRIIGRVCTPGHSKMIYPRIKRIPCKGACQITLIEIGILLFPFGNKRGRRTISKLNGCNTHPLFKETVIVLFRQGKGESTLLCQSKRKNICKISLIPGTASHQLRSGKGTVIIGITQIDIYFRGNRISRKTDQTYVTAQQTEQRNNVNIRCYDR